jgi:hypothetical protein
LDARDQWILFFSAGAMVLGLLLVWLVIRIKRRVDALDTRSNSIRPGDIGVIRTDISEMRRHMVSNHDELDGELRMINANTDSLALGLENDRKERIRKELPDELARARAAKDTTK